MTSFTFAVFEVEIDSVKWATDDLESACQMVENMALSGLTVTAGSTVFYPYNQSLDETWRPTIVDLASKYVQLVQKGIDELTISYDHIYLQLLQRTDDDVAFLDELEALLWEDEVYFPPVEAEDTILELRLILFGVEVDEEWPQEYAEPVEEDIESEPLGAVPDEDEIWEKEGGPIGEALWEEVN